MVRTLIPIALFVFQLGAIVYARFVPTRYFCWAPYDTQTDYVATATVNGKKLTGAEFRQRYRRPPRGFDNRAPQHVFDMLEQVEEKRPRSERLTVEEAVRAYTESAASSAPYLPHVTGTLSPGSAADLLILDRDIFTVLPPEIKHARPLATIVAGRPVYDPHGFFTR